MLKMKTKKVIKKEIKIRRINQKTKTVSKIQRHKKDKNVYTIRRTSFIFRQLFLQNLCWYCDKNQDLLKNLWSFGCCMGLWRKRMYKLQSKAMNTKVL